MRVDWCRHLNVSNDSRDSGGLERFMLWADDEFGFDFTWLLIVIVLAALGGFALLISWLL
jgi:hypothetical protein